MLQDILSGIPLGFFLAFMVGPAFFILLETAAIRGFKAAFAFDIGVILADIVFIFIAYFSTNQLLRSIKDDPGLFIFGGGVLTIYGLIAYIKAKNATYTKADFEVQKLKRKDYLGIVAKGFLLNFINIGVLGFWLGLLIIFGPSLEMEASRLVIFFTSIIVTYLLVDVLKILLAKKLNNKLTPRRITLFKKGISFLLIIFGLILILRGLIPKEIEEIEKNLENVSYKVDEF
ncbi:amino acid exporter, LysE superfamily protein [Psychroflexus gondwanensis ACAM 44]|jgi:threonine/homoserine/homoserine lactone efflux protein|uniref:Amino acid exporter, LysE superfamily protein n=1 Tax=Psychroflexus gondwanensis ACAM 44 TaxID=1189619 RepID=N1WZR5_9FLAO|nr:LysE family transporter [Psychroflexus gondwanensis]EMY82569.1 amino acid exporter, LysE superfamily protein [Psychroflexus gondwanensis ACAM 44]